MANLPVLLAGGAGLFLGAAVGYLLHQPTAREPAPTGSPLAGAADAGAARELVRLRAEHDELRLAYETLRGASDPERQRLARADASPDRRPAEPAPAGSEPRALGDAPAVSFGTWQGEPALRAADWPDIGIRAHDLVRARSAGIGGGQPPEMAALGKKALRELRSHLDRIETERPELRGHPVVVVNLMASHLQRAGEPFQPWQIEAIEAAGRDYESQAERSRRELAARGTGALATEKKLRSIQLRKAVVDRIVADVLTRAQWDVLFDGETKGLLYYDVYQVGGLELERPNSSVYWRDVPADAREHLLLFLLTEWELAREDVDRLVGLGLVDQWLDAILALPKVKGHPTSAMHIDEVLPCAEVHVAFQQKILAALARDGSRDPARAEKIRQNAVFAVFPRLRGPR